MTLISQMIKDLTEQYKELSVECMEDLCDMAGVEYREPKEAELLVKDMLKRGYKVKVVKYNHDGCSVGQYLILTDMDLNVVHGYKIYIDFERFAIHKENITENEQVPFLKEGMIH